MSPCRKTNRFLSLVMRHLRKGRPLGTAAEYGYFIESTMFRGNPYRLPLAWLVTRGCRNDRAGGCTYCNFGIGDTRGLEPLLWQVDQIPQNVGRPPMLYITPLGSMFDDGEVPFPTRDAIFRKVRDAGCTIFGTESRADTISDDRMAHFREVFGPKVELQIGLGLESSDDYVRRNCMNKRLTKNEFLPAVETMHRYGIKAMVHILLKPPFLHEGEAIADSVASCEWAFAHGADRVIFFMTNLKPFTLATWLSDRGRYRVPYLWCGISVLRQIAASPKRPVTLSGFYSGVPIGQLPANCAACSGHVISELQRFSKSLQTELLDQVMEYPCSCRSEWEAALQREPRPLPPRLRDEYEFVAVQLFGEEWWRGNREWVEAELDPSLAC